MPIDEAAAARVIALLNEAHALDPEAINALVNHRVPCNAALAEHPTIQCGNRDSKTTIGIVGLLNGLCGIDADGNGAVASCNDREGESYTVVGFQRFGAKTGS